MVKSTCLLGGKKKSISRFSRAERKEKASQEDESVELSMTTVLSLPFCKLYASIFDFTFLCRKRTIYALCFSQRYFFFSYYIFFFSVHVLQAKSTDINIYTTSIYVYIKGSRSQGGYIDITTQHVINKRNKKSNVLYPLMLVVA